MIRKEVSKRFLVIHCRLGKLFHLVKPRNADSRSLIKAKQLKALIVCHPLAFLRIMQQKLLMLLIALSEIS